MKPGNTNATSAAAHEFRKSLERMVAMKRYYTWETESELYHSLAVKQMANDEYQSHRQDDYDSSRRNTFNQCRATGLVARMSESHHHLLQAGASDILKGDDLFNF